MIFIFDLIVLLYLKTNPKYYWGTSPPNPPLGTLRPPQAPAVRIERFCLKKMFIFSIN